jgi:hypothetical protein
MRPVETRVESDFDEFGISYMFELETSHCLFVSVAIFPPGDSIFDNPGGLDVDFFDEADITRFGLDFGAGFID